MAAKRTVMRSKAGKKLYAVRDKEGKFKDIQTYQRAQAADMRHKSKAELEAATKKSASKKSTTKKSVAKKKTAKKGVKKPAPKPKTAGK